MHRLDTLAGALVLPAVWLALSSGCTRDVSAGPDGPGPSTVPDGPAATTDEEGGGPQDGSQDGGGPDSSREPPEMPANQTPEAGVGGELDMCPRWAMMRDGDSECWRGEVCWKPTPDITCHTRSIPAHDCLTVGDIIPLAKDHSPAGDGVACPDGAAWGEVTTDDGPAVCCTPRDRCAMGDLSWGRSLSDVPLVRTPMASACAGPCPTLEVYDDTVCFDDPEELYAMDLGGQHDYTRVEGCGFITWTESTDEYTMTVYDAATREVVGAEGNRSFWPAQDCLPDGEHFYYFQGGTVPPACEERTVQYCYFPSLVDP